MKFQRMILAGAIFSTTTLSSVLSGCATTAQSQPIEANKTEVSADAPWRAKFGQKCSLLYSTSVGNSLVVDGVLKSTTDKWIVIGDVESADAVNGKIVYSTEEQYIPLANILCLSFSKAKKNQ